MSSDSGASRRRFMRLCASTVALIGTNPRILADEAASLHRYPKVRLVNTQNHSVTVDDLAVGEAYVFHYPYESTPCFLIDVGQAVDAGTALQTEEGATYQWPGGIGPGRSIVAFSAICAHRMSHPAREVTFINYRHKPVSFRNRAEERVERAQVIYCCSEMSVYDPLQGARVLGGPAKQPLAAILLESAEDGTIFATGTLGGEMFQRFFREFGSRLILAHGTYDIEKLAADSTAVMPLDEFCQNQILCGTQS
jgi:arsenite oxidase small subunit